MLTCSKTYRDVPLSHRQPRHPGRCSRIHGHSWAITLTFAADEPDEHGFVVVVFDRLKQLEVCTPS